MQPRKLKKYGFGEDLKENFFINNAFKFKDHTNKIY